MKLNKGSGEETMKYNPYRGIVEMCRKTKYRKDVKRRMHRAFRRAGAFDSGPVTVSGWHI